MRKSLSCPSFGLSSSSASYQLNPAVNSSHRGAWEIEFLVSFLLYTESRGRSRKDLGATDSRLAGSFPHSMHFKNPSALPKIPPNSQEA